MQKLVLKTALITLASVLVLALLVYGVLSLFVPSAMVSLTDKLGMDGACARYSVSVYEKTGDIDDLASAVERSYGAERYGDAAEYGVILLEREDFSSYCERRENAMAGQKYDYAQFAAGIVSVSLYYDGQTDAAVKVAFDAVGSSFPTGNAVIYLLSAACDAEKDADTCRILLTALQELRGQLPAGAQEDAEAVSQWITLLETFLSQG